MSRGFVLRAENSQKQFHALPIRIGRNALNDFPLPFNFVSAFHARLEDVHGAVHIVDLSSKNGVFVRHEDGTLLRIPPGEPINLSLHGNEFLVGPNIAVHLEAMDLGGTDRSFSGSVLGNREMLEISDASRPSEQAGQWKLAPLPSLGSSGSPQGMPKGADRGNPAPAWGPGRSDHETGHFAMDLGALAVVGLRELTASLVPGQALETTGDVARLITRLHDAVEVFCRCFVPLREGHAEFVSNLDLEREQTQRRKSRSAGYSRVDRARTPEEVAAALLDFRDPSQDAAAAVEGIFADLMGHQVALLEGMMEGVRALLDELSPERIEEATRANAGALSLAFGQYRALWNEYSARHETLCNEKRAVARIFGAEFAEAFGKRRGD